MPNNGYENFGVEITVDGVNSAVSNLDRFEKRYEKIAGTEIRVAKAQIALKNAHISLQQSEQSLANATKVSENAQKQKEIAVNNVAKAHERLLAIEKNEKATDLQRTVAVMNYNNALLQQGIAENNLTIANTNLDKARETQEKRVNAVTTAELSLQQAMEAAEKQQNRTTKSLTAYLAKLSSGVMIARRLGRFVSGAIQESAAYTENLVLFSTAFGKSTEEQLKWALGLADAYGLARNEVVKFAGTFRELASSLGIVGETADNVTRIVTNLGYDLSALYNTSVQKAMEKLQSGVFTGQTKPLRYFGVDISQESIDRLFETNEALAGLGVNARNLSQREKVLARLLITMNGARNSFGTMAKEINNLQSQFRIFQGSLSNFKLAIGNLVQEPLKNGMIYINAFIIALTNVVNTFSPKRKDDNTVFDNTTEGAEEATEAIDKLNGKLASFDKFNVLGQGGDSSSTLAVTEELNKLIAEEAELYEKEVAEAMKEVKNEAVELAKKLKDAVVIGGTLLTIFSISKFSAITNSIKNIAEGFSNLTGATTKLNKGLSLTNTLLVTGIIYTIYKAVEAFKEGDDAAGWLAITMGVTLVGAWVLLNREAIKTTTIKIVGWLEKLNSALTSTTPKLLNGARAFEKQKVSAQQAALAIGAMVGAYFLADSIINSFDGETRKTASGIMVLVGAIMAVTAAIVAMNTAISWGTMLPVLLAGVGTAIAGVKGLMTDVEDISRSAHADGGYTNANLIMTHENGKREWVGKAAGSSAIVNDTQMSDIMELAVAKGVHKALSAQNSIGRERISEQPIVVKIGEEPVFNAVRRVARRQGKDFLNL